MSKKRKDTDYLCLSAQIRSMERDLLDRVRMERMLDAQKHPENHRRLVVRIWGWSAYFVELDKEYQDHVIARQAYTV